MKKVLLFATFFFGVQTIFCQETKRSSITVSIGPALPLGNFAKTNLYDESSGFAKLGGRASLEYTMPVSTQFSFLVKLSGQTNPIDKGQFENSFSNAKFYDGIYLTSDPNNPPPQTSYTIYPNWNFEKRSWGYIALQIGSKALLPISKNERIWITAEASGGALYARFPGINGASATDTSTATFVQSKSSGWGIIYSVGGSFNYKFSKSMFFISKLNYTGTGTVTFDDVESTLTTTKGALGTPNLTYYQSMTKADGKQVMNSVDLTFGIGIIL